MTSADQVDRLDEPEEWILFICYRQTDGTEAAFWLQEQLDGQPLPFVPQGLKTAPVLRTYFDQKAAAVDDFVRLHQPALERARAFLFVVSPGSRILLDDQEDWVHRELDWWLDRRQAAPVLIDATGEGDRWIPEKIRRRWPNAQRVDVLPVEWKRLGVEERARASKHAVAQILGGIQESEQRTSHEDYEQEKQRRVRLEAQAKALQRQRFGMGILLGVAIAALICVYSLWKLAKEREALLRASSILGQAAMAEDPAVKARLLSELRGLPEPEGGLRLARDVANSPIPARVIGGVDAVAIGPAGRFLAWARQDQLELFDLERPEVTTRAQSMAGTTRKLVISRDGRRAAAVLRAGDVQVFDLPELRPVLLRSPDCDIEAVAFSPDSRKIVTMTKSGEVWISSLAGTRRTHDRVPIDADLERGRLGGVEWSSTGDHVLISGWTKHRGGIPLESGQH